MRGREKDFANPLGMGVLDVPQRKEWIVSAIGAGVGLATSLLGGAKASQAAREAERRQRKQEAAESAWYNRRYNEDYLDTKAGQNLVTRAKEYAREQAQRAAGAQAVAGGTPAATQMAKDAGNKMVGDTIANIGATDEARKANVDNQHRQAEAQFAQMDMQREQQRANNITQAAQGASNAILGAAGAIEQAGVQKTNLAGGYNNSTPAPTPAPTTEAKPIEMANGETLDSQTAQDRIDKYNATLG